MQTIRALEEITNNSGYDMALTTTFNIDVDFFEKSIVGKLLENGTRKIALFVDSKELNKGIAKSWKKSLLLGTHYSVNPIRISGAFHPKVMLLLSEDRAKLIVSSANYTVTGFTTNNEAMSVFEYSEEHTENLHLIVGAINFFKKLYELSYDLDPQILEELNKSVFMHSPNYSNDDSFLIHNLDITLVDQVKKIVKDAASIDIAVPFYDNNLDALEGLMKGYPNASINCYVQNHESRFNVKLAKQKNKVDIRAFNAFKEPKSSSFYHGKVIRIKTNNESWVLYGSANCTTAALLSTHRTGGNVECCILEKGDKKEFDYYFSNIILQDPKEEIVCNLLDYNEKESSEKYYFKYGIINEHNVELNIGVIGKYESPIITIGDDIVAPKFNPSTNSIVINLPVSEYPMVDGILEVELADGKDTYKVNCWAINTKTIQSFRDAENSRKEFSYRDDAEGDERLEYIINLLTFLAAGQDEISKKKKIVELIERKEPQDNTPGMEYEDVPEGIVDYVIPPRIPTLEEQLQYRNYKKAEIIGKTFLEEYLKKNSKDSRGINYTHDKTNKKPVTSASASNHHRKPTGTEKRAKRFIRSFVNRMCEKGAPEMESTELFIQKSCIIIETMNRYSYALIPDLFDIDFLLDIRLDLLDALLSMEDSPTKGQIELILWIAVANHYIEFRYSKSFDEREYEVVEILRKIITKYDIRERIEDYITKEATAFIGDDVEDVFFTPDQFGKVEGVRPSRREIISYIEGVCGYKTQSQIKELIIKNFGKKCSFDISDEVFYIRARLKLTGWFNGDRWLMKEIEKYCKHYNLPVKSIVFDIEAEEVPNTANPAVRLTFEKRVGVEKIIMYEYHKHGDPIEEVI